MGTLQHLNHILNPLLLHQRFTVVSVVGIAISGSRCRGLEGKYSDLDVVVELFGNEREDDLFNLFHEDGFSIGGVPVDINPITEKRTGTLEEYLPGVEKYLEEKSKKPSIKKRLAEKKKEAEYRSTITNKDAIKQNEER